MKSKKSKKLKLGPQIGLIITILVIVLTGLFAYEYSNQIYLFYRDNILRVKDHLTINDNKYYKNADYIYVQNTNNFVVKDRQHLLNALYSIINSGNDKFTFYCDKDYKLCIKDLETILSDHTTLSNINNFVHPYNSFKQTSASYDSYGKITVKYDKVYTEDDIKQLNKKVDEVISGTVSEDMTDKQKIEKIHDYIINNGNYATDVDNLKYNKANDILINGKGICSSYADAMAIFLNKLKIDNYKIASKDHIWNLVKIDDNWLHVDLTWDDPVSSDGKNYLEKTTLLINNKRLKQIDSKEHNFDTTIYVEGK